jgi:hypothetical protein
MTDVDTGQGPPVPRDSRYEQQIIKFAGTMFYLRIDTGPDLESVLLCLDDGEPDTYEIARLPGLKMANIFVAVMRQAGHAAIRQEPT